MERQYTNQEIREFYDNSRKPDEQGCYNLHVQTWGEMLRQDPIYCCEIELEYRMETLKRKFKHED